MFGFKQSGRIWNHIFYVFLVLFELEPTEADLCIYVSKSKSYLIVTLFVDDGLACCASLTKLEALIQHMEKQFAITQSSAALYVGMHIHRDESAKKVYVNQSIYLFAQD